MPAHCPEPEGYPGGQEWQDKGNGVSPEAPGADLLGGSRKVSKRQLHTNSPAPRSLARMFSFCAPFPPPKNALGGTPQRPRRTQVVWRADGMGLTGRLCTSARPLACFSGARSPHGVALVTAQATAGDGLCGPLPSSTHPGRGPWPAPAQFPMPRQPLPSHAAAPRSPCAGTLPALPPTLCASRHPAGSARAR